MIRLVLASLLAVCAWAQVTLPQYRGVLVRSGISLPQTSPVARYYFDAGSGSTIADSSGNGRNITIPADTHAPAWGNRRLVFTTDDYLLTPNLPINMAGAWTVMFTMSRIGTTGTPLSVVDRTSDWRFVSLTISDELNRKLSSSDGAASAGLRTDQSAFAVYFIIYDKTAGTTGTATMLRADTGETWTISPNLASVNQLAISLGICARLNPYAQVDAMEAASLAVWNKVLTPSQISAEYAYESARLGPTMTFPVSVDDVFDRADTALGDLGTSTSGWRWELWTGGTHYGEKHGQVLNHVYETQEGYITYASACLKQKVATAVATFSFTPGSNSAQSSAVVAIGISADEYHFQTMVHITVNRSQMLATIWENGTAISGAPNLYHALNLPKDDTLHTLTATVSGNTLTVTIDGTISESMTDSRISTHTGRYVYFEHYYDSATAESVLHIHRVQAN